MYMCLHTTIYIYPDRSEVAGLETEHAVKVMLRTKPLYASMLLTKPLCRSEVAVLETEHTVNVIPSGDPARVP
jgi:hypothetical protein